MKILRVKLEEVFRDQIFKAAKEGAIKKNNLAAYHTTTLTKFSYIFAQNM